MNRFEATLDYLYNRLPMFQRIGPAAYKHSMDTTHRLDDLYNHPHRHYPTLHVAGTNGKGSVSHILASVLQASGYKTGLYTSPHLVDFRERIRINGRMIPKNRVVSWVADWRTRNEDTNISPSFFELTAAMAFDFFATEKVDVAVIETGLGGRLDSTNIITPEVSIITNISYDHVSLLGDTLEKIALEKAGIIKKGIPVVISQYQPEVADVFLRKAAEAEAPLSFASDRFRAAYGLLGTDGRQLFNFSEGEVMRYPNLKTDLPGIYQRLNIPAVLETVTILRSKGWQVSDKNLYRGLANVTKSTGLRGRWEIISHNPLVICDTGHNEDGIRQVTEQLRQTPYRNLHFVLGTVADKDPAPILTLLPPDAIYYFTRANIPRALDENILKQMAKAAGLQGNAYPAVSDAYRAALNAAGTQDLIFIGGSNFVVAEVLTSPKD